MKNRKQCISIIIDVHNTVVSWVPGIFICIEAATLTKYGTWMLTQKLVFAWDTNWRWYLYMILHGNNACVRL